MRKKLEFFFYLTEMKEKVWGSHYIYICAREGKLSMVLFLWGAGFFVWDNGVG